MSDYTDSVMMASDSAASYYQQPKKIPEITDPAEAMIVTQTPSYVETPYVSPVSSSYQIANPYGKNVLATGVPAGYVPSPVVSPVISPDESYKNTLEYKAYHPSEYQLDADSEKSMTYALPAVAKIYGYDEEVNMLKERAALTEQARKTEAQAKELAAKSDELTAKDQALYDKYKSYISFAGPSDPSEALVGGSTPVWTGPESEFLNYQKEASKLAEEAKLLNAVSVGFNQEQSDLQAKYDTWQTRYEAIQGPGWEGPSIGGWAPLSFHLGEAGVATVVSAAAFYPLPVGKVVQWATKPVAWVGEKIGVPKATTWLGNKLGFTLERELPYVTKPNVGYAEALESAKFSPKVEPVGPQWPKDYIQEYPVLARPYQTTNALMRGEPIQGNPDLAQFQYGTSGYIVTDPYAGKWVNPKFPTVTELVAGKPIPSKEFVPYTPSEQLQRAGVKLVDISGTKYAIMTNDGGVVNIPYLRSGPGYVWAPESIPTNLQGAVNRGYIPYVIGYNQFSHLVTQNAPAIAYRTQVATEVEVPTYVELQIAPKASVNWEEMYQMPRISPAVMPSVRTVTIPRPFVMPPILPQTVPVTIPTKEWQPWQSLYYEPHITIWTPPNVQAKNNVNAVPVGMIKAISEPGTIPSPFTQTQTQVAMQKIVQQKVITDFDNRIIPDIYTRPPVKPPVIPPVLGVLPKGGSGGGGIFGGNVPGGPHENLYGFRPAVIAEMPNVTFDLDELANMFVAPDSDWRPVRMRGKIKSTIERGAQTYAGARSVRGKR